MQLLFILFLVTYSAANNFLPPNPNIAASPAKKKLSNKNVTMLKPSFISQINKIPPKK